MTIDIAFKLLKIVVIRKTSKQKGVPQMRHIRKEIVRAEEAVTFNNFNSKKVGL